MASKLGIPVVTLSSGGKAGNPKAMQQALKDIRSICEFAESWKVSIAIKPHVGASVHNTSTALEMLERVDSSSIGIIVRI